MKAIAVHPGTPNSMHLREVERPSVTDVEGGRRVLVQVLRCGVDGTDKEINAAEYGDARLPLGQLARRARAKWHAAWTDPVVVSGAGEPSYAAPGRRRRRRAGRVAPGRRRGAGVPHRPRRAPRARGVPHLGGGAGLYPCPAMGDGEAVVAWRGDGDLVRVARRGSGGWLAPEPLTAPGAAPGPPLAAVDGAGRVTVAY